MPNTILERVLIPLDGSARAEAILHLLQPILERTPSEVFLVRALDAPPATTWQEADRYLQGVAQRLQNEGVCAHAMATAGAPSQVMESLACDEDVTLIAMSTQAGAERMMCRSARAMLALSPRPTEDLALPPPRRILVPLDGSEPSRRSLPVAVDLAEPLDAHLVLLQVIERPSDEAAATRDLQTIAEHLCSRGTIAEPVVEIGDPVETILKVGRERNVRLIVQAARGRSEPADQPFGDVTLQVMARSSVPVLAVHVAG